MKEYDIKNEKDLQKIIDEFDLLYDLKTVILLGREAGVRRIDFK